MKKTEEKKAALFKAYAEKLKPFRITCAELGISRQSAYKWLASEGIEAKKEHATCRSRIGRFARENGVCLPTARKYLAAQDRAEKEGVISAEGLSAVGINKREQREVVRVLKELEIEVLCEEDNIIGLSRRGAVLRLNVSEIIELFKEPTKTLRKILA